MWVLGGTGHVCHTEIILFSTDETAKLSLSAFNHKQDDVLRLKVFCMWYHACVV